MGGGFHPYRRDVEWTLFRHASILPLLQTLEFSAGVKNWGYQFRYGLFAISEHDMRMIAMAMGTECALFKAGNACAELAAITNLQLSLGLS